MDRKILGVALGAVLVVAGAGFYFAGRQLPPEEARKAAEAASREGAIAPDAANVGMKTQPMPQVSEERFTPPPTITTGTYPAPDHLKPAKPKTPN